MKLTGIVILVYGVITLAGGIIGYMSARSMVSLISGGVFGAILIIDSFYIFKSNSLAIYLALAISIILSVTFGIRFSKTFSMVPTGLMLIVSLIAAGFAVYGLSLRE